MLCTICEYIICSLVTTSILHSASKFSVLHHYTVPIPAVAAASSNTSFTHTHTAYSTHNPFFARKKNSIFRFSPFVVCVALSSAHWKMSLNTVQFSGKLYIIYISIILRPPAKVRHAGALVHDHRTCLSIQLMYRPHTRIRSHNQLVVEFGQTFIRTQ